MNKNGTSNYVHFPRPQSFFLNTGQTCIRQINDEAIQIKGRYFEVSHQRDHTPELSSSRVPPVNACNSVEGCWTNNMYSLTF
jgi:hypothetical protein